MKFQTAAWLALNKPHWTSTAGRTKRRNYSQKLKEEDRKPPYSGMGANGGDGWGWEVYE